MTNQIALEFDGWKNAGLETNGPNEIPRDICCIQVISIVLLTCEHAKFYASCLLV